MKKREHKYLLKHETKRHILRKFQIVVAVTVAYFILISLRYGLGEGLTIGLVTWSFFVLCTPVADAGFLFDFPIRLLTGIRMFYTEHVILMAAVIINVAMVKINPLIYNKTILLSIFKKIIINPFPYWGVIFLSAIGTLLSVYFADELMDVARHPEREKYHRHKFKHHLVITASLVVLVIIIYGFMLKELGIEIPLF
ncbi:hypothetical protein KY312_00675 [Candidatus Woesearchaeota archaeon]|nr:hypothetical protein [Candidatus Woesearchaeota archaeon]